MMKLKKLKLVAIALAMASLGSCGMKEGSQKNSKIKDFYNKDANESVYRVRPVDENPIYVLGNWLNLAVGGYDGFAWAEKTNEYLLITGSGSSDTSRDGHSLIEGGVVMFGPYVTTQTAGITYAEIDLELNMMERDDFNQPILSKYALPGVFVDFSYDSGRVIESRWVYSTPGRQTITFQPVKHDTPLQNIEVRVHKPIAPATRCVEGHPMAGCFKFVDPGYTTVKVYETRIHHIQPL